MTNQFTCTICKLDITHDSELTTGYGLDKADNKICFACCGIRDKADMVATGKATLYLTGKDTTDGKYGMGTGTGMFVSNWPGTLKFPCTLPDIGHHNFAGKRYTVRFVGPDGYWWTGTQYGDNTQVCHCKRTREHSIKRYGYKIVRTELQGDAKDGFNSNDWFTLKQWRTHEPVSDRWMLREVRDLFEGNYFAWSENKSAPMVREGLELQDIGAEHMLQVEYRGHYVGEVQFSEYCLDCGQDELEHWNTPCLAIAAKDSEAVYREIDARDRALEVSGEGPS